LNGAVHRLRRLAAVAMLALLAACAAPPMPDPPFRPDLDPLGPLRQQKIFQAEARIEALREEAADRDQLAEAYGRLAMLYHAYKLYGGAASNYAVATDLAPETMRWHYLQGRVAYAQARADDAFLHFQEAARLEPNYTPALVELGERHRALNRFDQAAARFREALARDSACVPAMVGLAQIANAQRRYGEALELMQRALKIQPHADTLHYIAALAHRGLGQADEARAAFRRSEEEAGTVTLVDPLMRAVTALGADAREAFELGELALAENRPADALAHVREAVEADPSHIEYRLKLAWLRLRHGDKAGALADYRAALAQRPGNAEILFNIGGLLLETGKPEEAADALEKAVSLKPDFAAAQRLLADAQRLAGRFEAALASYQTWHERAPANPAARLGRALLATRLGRYAEARAWLSEDAADFPHQPAFIQALARILAAAPASELRDGLRAVELVQPLIQRGGVDAPLAETAAMALAEAGRFDLAIQWQERAIELARQAGQADEAQAMQPALAAYRAKKPSREPWRPDHPIFRAPSYGR